MELLQAKRERSNLRKFVCAGVLSVTASSICSEGYLQAQLLEFDNGAWVVGAYGVIAQIASAMGYVLFLFDTPDKKGFQIRFMLCGAMQTLLPLVLSGLLPGSKVAALALACGFIYHFSLAYRGSCEQAAIPALFSRKVYSGALVKVNMIGVVISMLLSLMIKGGSTSLLLCAIAGFCGTTIVISLYRMDFSADWERREKWKGIPGCFTAKTFLPHCVRGFAVAGMYYFTVYCMERNPLSESQKNAMVFFSIAGTMTGYFVYDRLKKIRSGVVTYAAFIGCALCMTISPLLTTVWAFFAGYYVLTACISLASMAITIGVFKSTDNKDLAFVTAARMLLMNGSCAIGTSIFAVLYGTFWRESVIVISVAVLVAAAVLYRRSLTDQCGVA